MKFLVPALLSAVSLSAFAQAEDSNDDETDGQPPGWGVGLVAGISDSPYAGESARLLPIPYITYEGERFFFQGITAGWRFVETESFELAALVNLRVDEFDVDELGRTELAGNGIDYDLLEDREIGFDIGLGMEWSGAAGAFEVELLADATDTSGGQEVSLQYSHPFQVGEGILTPSAGITWMSDDMANYYYGTLDTEVARGVVDYKPGAVTIPNIGISYFRPIGEKWLLIATIEYSRLPHEITDSPLIEPGTDGSASLFIGFSRGF